MTKMSATFGKAREITELETEEEIVLWLAHLQMGYQDRDPVQEKVAQSNTSGMFQLSWLCPACENEHRITAPWVQVITAQQQILTMGMAVATSVAHVDNARLMDNIRICEALDDCDLQPSDAVSDKLASVFDKPKGSA